MVRGPKDKLFADSVFQISPSVINDAESTLVEVCSTVCDPGIDIESFSSDGT